MWRTAFFLLVLANLVFFAWGQGYLGGQDEGREPARLSGQVYPEKLRVVGQGGAIPDAACRMVEGLMPAEAASLRVFLEGEGLTAVLRSIAEPPVFRVHIPPQPGKAAADKKAAELRQLGVKDFEVSTEEGPDRFSILLGLFGDEQAANGALAELAGKGVRSARIEVRERAPERVRIEVRGDAVAERLPALLAGHASAVVTGCP